MILECRMAFPAFAVGKQQVLPLVALVVLVTVTVLTSLSLLIQQPAIETDLLQRARQALAEADLPTHLIQFDGRDGVLTGTVAEADAARLQAIVSNVYGVRQVENHLIPVSTATAQQILPETLPPNASVGLHTPAKKYPIEQVDLGVIQFAYARADLDAPSMTVLARVLTELRQHPSMVIEVSAHTESAGTALGNMAVSQARADVVRDYLLSQGIEAKQVLAKGYGSTRPVVDHASADGASKNRRIEITVLQE
jgi:outer membrane protein OmpA-like peptidoglycan-associated protein